MIVMRDEHRPRSTTKHTEDTKNRSTVGLQSRPTREVTTVVNTSRTYGPEGLCHDCRHLASRLRRLSNRLPLQKSTRPPYRGIFVFFVPLYHFSVFMTLTEEEE